MLTLKNKVGKRIKNLRHKKEITQEQLAEKANISVDFVSLVERGINAPSLDSLEKIAKAFEIPVEEIFKENE